MQVLEQHTAQRGDGFRVLVGVKGDEQNQFLVDHLVERQQVVIGAGDDRKIVLEKRHQFVQESLNLWHSFPVFEGLLEIAN